MTARPRPAASDADDLLVDREHPWPGLAAFREQDKLFFHGRDAEIRHLERLVEREPITLLYGVAGHGKTSLLQAGLFPRLRDKDYCPVYIRLDHCEDAPELAAQVRTAIAEERHIKQRPGLDRASLWEDFHHVDAEFWGARNRLLTPILVFDQFEEIFTLGRSSAAARGRSEAFLAELADLVEGRPPQAFLDRLEDDPDLGRAYAFDRRLYKVLLSLREEYLAEIEALRSYFPPMSYNRFRLCRMDGANAKAAVVGAGGDLIEANVAEELVRFVAAEAESESTELGQLEVEPAFLSVVCRELNNKRPPGKKITLDLLQGNREEILTEFYRRSLKGMPPELRTFIEDGLLTVDGFRDSEDWHNALEEPGVEAAHLQELVRRRLLRIEETRHRRRIELIHDLLIDVVADSRDRRRREQRLAAERRQQEEELERRRRELDRVRRFFIAGALVALIFIAIGGLALWQWRRAESSRATAQEAVVQGAGLLIETGQVRDGFAYLAQALRQDPENYPARSLLFDFLSRRSWPRLEAVYATEAPARSVHFSPDGRRLAITCLGGEVELWGVRGGRLSAPSVRLPGSFMLARFAPDSTRVVTMSEDQTARVWDAASGRPLSPPMRHQESVTSARFSPDGRSIVTGADDGIARLWDAGSGQPIGRPMRHGSPVSLALYSPDGRRLLTTGKDHVARLWDTASGRPLGRPMPHDAPLRSAQFSPDGRRLVVTSYTVARFWDAFSGQPLSPVLRHEASIRTTLFSPDGERVLTASIDRTARIWDAASGQPIGLPMRHRAPVTSARFAPDGRSVVTAALDGTVRQWDADSGQPLGEAMNHRGRMFSAQFSPGGRLIVTTCFDGKVRFWRPASQETGTQILRHERLVAAAVFSPDGSRIVTASGTTAHLWRADSGQETLEEPLQHEDRVQSAELSPDGRRIVTASRDGTARLWDAESGAPVGEPMRHEGQVHRARFSPDGRLVATASTDATARLWAADSGRPFGRPLRHDAWVFSAEFSPDGRRIVTASADCTARLWEVATQSVLQTIQVEGVGSVAGGQDVQCDPIHAASFSPDGRRVAIASGGHASCWHAASGRLVAEYSGHWGHVYSIAVSPDGTRVVTASVDRTARLWDARSGEQLSSLRHQAHVGSARFSPDGRRIVTASYDDTARLWDAQTGQPLSEPLRHDGSVHSARFSPDGRRLVTASANGVARVWDVPVGSAAVSRPLARLAEATVGYRVNDRGTVTPVERPDLRLQELHREAEQRAGDGGPWDVWSFILWFMADPSTRTVSPFSVTTVPEYLEREAAWHARRPKPGSEAADLEIALELDPG